MRFIGLFDVVGEFGLPGEHVNAGHNLQHAAQRPERLPRDGARRDAAVLSADAARRAADPPTGVLLQEVWFRGVHSDVGGGNENPTSTAIALNWLFQNAKRCGLPIRESDVLANLAGIKKPRALSAHKIDPEVKRQIRDTDLLHASVVIETGGRGSTTRARTCRASTTSGPSPSRSAGIASVPDRVIRSGFLAATRSSTPGGPMTSKVAAALAAIALDAAAAARRWRSRPKPTA